ncbi:MAG: hypothetical protein M1829_005450 [Trizodia sp. TS-e1964]|nr:MAG: hypothetical protein M1829_005450 [Trizodia sp. TS-e1964]
MEEAAAAMDPLSTTASIVAVLQIADTVIRYLKSVKDAQGDCRKILSEVVSITGVIHIIENDIKANANSGDRFGKTLLCLNAPNGPLKQLKATLENLEIKLAPAHGFKKVQKALVWPFEKGEIKEILERIHRLQTLFNLALDNDHVKLSQEINRTVVSTLNVVVELQNSQRDLQSRAIYKERTAICEWLSPLNFPLQQNDLFSRHQPQTGQWFIDSDQFKEWIKVPRTTLVSIGIPGAGKTILSAIVVNHIETAVRGTDSNIGIAYIYCNYKRQLEQSAQNLIGSLLKQLLQQQALIPDEVKKHYESHRLRNTFVTMDEIFKLLLSAINMFSRVFIVVDALDECPEQDGVRRVFMAKILEMLSATKVNLMATSREIPKIVQAFKGALKLEIRASDEDVRKYVEGRIPDMAQKVQASTALQDIIKNGIAEAVEGMFLLAQLHLDSLRDKTSPKAIKKAVTELPRGSEALESAYRQALVRILDQQRGLARLAKLVLCWISFAKRPLKIEELEHAIAIEQGETEFDEENITSFEESISVCAGLVTLDEESREIRLVHYTTQEYFERVRSQIFSDALEFITIDCLTYLNFEIFSSRRHRSIQSIPEKSQYPLYDYAAKNWGFHAKEHESEDTSNLAFKFLQSPASTLCMNYIRSSNAEYYGTHVCAYFGLDALLKELLKIPYGVRYVDSGSFTPLFIAASEGNDEVVKLLVDRNDVRADSECNGNTPFSSACEKRQHTTVLLLGSRTDVNINYLDDMGWTPLSISASRGRNEVVRVLLNFANIKADTRDNAGRSPLWWAAQKGNLEIVKLLADREDVLSDSRNDKGDTPLSVAAEWGRLEVVKYLANREDVKANSENDKMQTPLWHAMANEHEETVTYLANREDVDVNHKDRNGMTVLSCAAYSGLENMVKLLANRGDVDVSSRDKYGWTPLAKAVSGGYLEVVKYLANREDVDADSRDDDGRSPLSHADVTDEDNSSIAEYLASREDVDVNSEDNDGMTPLAWTAAAGNFHAVASLLKCPPIKVNAPDKDGFTPLSHAALRGRKDIVLILANHQDADLNFKDKWGDTAFAQAVSSEKIELVKFLAGLKGIEVDSGDIAGRTPLSQAAEYGTEEVVEFLVDRQDVDVNSKNEEGRTPIIFAARAGRKELVKLLLARKDLSVDSKDCDGRTALSWATVNGFREVVELLVSRDDVSINLKDKDGMTPLSLAMTNGYKEIVKLLEDRSSALDLKNTPKYFEVEVEAE